MRGAECVDGKSHLKPNIIDGYRSFFLDIGQVRD